MKIGDKINFVYQGSCYTGFFLEEQIDLFNNENISWTLEIKELSIRNELGLSKREALKINKEQCYNNQKEKKALLLKYPFENKNISVIEDSKENRNEKVLDQIDMFEAPISRNVPRRRF